jgi:hypothetical protein
MDKSLSKFQARRRFAVYGFNLYGSVEVFWQMLLFLAHIPKFRCAEKVTALL